jgi:hypothetical protein
MLRREGRTKTSLLSMDPAVMVLVASALKRLELPVEQPDVPLGLQEPGFSLRLTLNKVVTGGAVPPGLEGGATFGVSNLAWDRMPRTPMCQQAKGAGQFLTLGGQLVRGSGWALGVQPGHHQRVALEPLQPLGQNVRRNPWDVGLEVVESPRLNKQSLNDEQRPAITNASESLGEC